MLNNEIAITPIELCDLVQDQLSPTLAKRMEALIHEWDDNNVPFNQRSIVLQVDEPIGTFYGVPIYVNRENPCLACGGMGGFNQFLTLPGEGTTSYRVHEWIKCSECIK